MADSPQDSDATQSAFHVAFRAELYAILDALPVPRRGRLLDVPCGDGFYSRRLAERLGPGRRLTAVDTSDECLRLTAAATAFAGDAVEVRGADAYRLPFADASFDLVWCAQSFITLDPDRAAGEMLRVAKPTGAVAILEVDEYHHVLLPWPAELEAALPAAVHAACVRKYGSGVKLAPTRKLRGVLGRAGCESVRRVTYPFDRAAPFDAPTTAFLLGHFEYLRSFAYPHLPTRLRPAFDRATDPGAVDSILRRPDAELVCLNAVYLARPATSIT